MINLPENNRIWIYVASEKLSDEKVHELEKNMNTFLEDWSTHGHGLHSFFKLWDRCVLIIGVDETRYGASGCSVDKLTRFLTENENALHIQWMNRLQCAAWLSNELFLFKNTEVQNLMESKKILPDTPMVNLQIISSTAWNKNPFVKINESWLARFIQSEVK
jgi:hypothetical protein